MSLARGSMLLAVVLLLGCGPAGPVTYAISGKVSMAGEPVQAGTIAFIPVDGQGVPQGGPITDGRYAVRVSPGEKRVEIYAEKETGVTETQEDGKVVKLRASYIPDKYNQQSELTRQVEAKDAEIDFDLEK